MSKYLEFNPDRKEALVDCRTCSGKVAHAAKTCPHCGADRPSFLLAELEWNLIQSAPYMVTKYIYDLGSKIVKVLLLILFVLWLFGVVEIPFNKD